MTAADSSSELLLLTESNLVALEGVAVVAGKADEWPLDVEVDGLLNIVSYTVNIR